MALPSVSRLQATESLSIWTDSLIYSVYVALLSCVVLLFSGVVLPCFEQARSYKTPRPTRHANEIFAEESLFDRFRKHADACGGYGILGCRIAQLISSFALLILSMIVYVSEDSSNLSIEFPRNSDLEWLQFASCVTYGYTTILALLSVSLADNLSKTASKHATLVLLLNFSVYAYRDIYPLATYTLSPADLAEGWILWTKIAVLGLSSIVLPLSTPHQHIPFDPEHPHPPTPEETASLLSFSTFSFMNPVISAAGKVDHLPHTQLPPLSDVDDAGNLVKGSFPYLDPFSATKSRNTFWGLMRIFYWEHIIECVMLIIKCLTLYISPYSIGQLLNYLEDNGASATVRPWLWVVILFCGPAIGTIAVQCFTYLTNIVAVRTEAIITALVFEHALRIRVKAESSQALSASGAAEAGRLLGTINNLVTSDLNNITDGRNFLLLGLYSPVQVVLSIWFLYNILEWSAFVGMGIMILLFPLPGYIAKKLHGIQVEAMRQTDVRVESVTEILNVLRMIKLFGWERKMSEKLAVKRDAELGWIFKRQMLWLLNGTINYIIPLLYMMATYITYTVIMKRSLSASIVFPSMTVFEMLRLQLFTVFHWTPKYIQAKVSVNRIDRFLSTTEFLDMFSSSTDGAEVTPALTLESEEIIGFHEARFTWTDTSTDDSFSPSRRFFELVVDDLRFERGQINLIIGPTGAGKTSLLMALLGEMHFTPSSTNAWFNLPRERGVAYVPQETWVLNDTIKNNILFGAPYDAERYNKVIYQCGLERDLMLFEAGDETEVGEKGITLSGGQKARITLARAVYSSADILLLDDVLAALDVHTAKWIVDRCLKGSLVRGRTVLLVTHNMLLASTVAKFVVALEAGGRIRAQGSVSEVMPGKLSCTSAPEDDAEEGNAGDKVINGSKEDSGKLIADEELAEGRIGWPALKMYLLTLGGSWRMLFWVSVLGFLFACHALNTMQIWFLGYWAQQYDEHSIGEVPVSQYLTVYCLLLLISVLANYASHCIHFLAANRASRIIHERLMNSILATTLRWLDKTPTSRIMTRCTQDIRTLDGPMIMLTSEFLDTAASMLLKFVAISVLTPAFILPGILAAVFGTRLGQIFLRAQLAIKREMSAARAPVLGHFTAAIGGIISIRAYRAQEMYRRQLFARVNRYSKVARSFHNLNLWVALRMDLLGALLTSGLAAYLIYGKQLQTTSNAGFSLNMAVAFSGLILWSVIQFNEFQVQGNSLERIQQYLNIEQEPEATDARAPPAYWPSSGDLRVENLCARYSADGPDVLHNLSFHARPGERIGIVGRTGSGKSSLMLSLLRCILTSGKVYYDGIPTESLNLDDLRSKITIIPQDPELLSGSLRENLDPFSEHDDATLNDALRDAGLFSVQVENGRNNITLDTQIASGGRNLSIGQRQILALARAFIRQSKLLILDEATSAIDYNTEKSIRSSLRTKLGSDVTVISIAHRLQTVMDADTIIVLDAGHIVEMGPPTKLLHKEGSMFRALVDESHDKTALYELLDQ